MFCKNCGKEIDDNAYVCLNCGAKVGNDLSKGIAVGKSGKSKVAAGLFGIFLGDIGVNNFYMGNIGLGIVDILFCWTFIPALVNTIRGIVYLCESNESFESRLR